MMVVEKEEDGWELCTWCVYGKIMPNKEKMMPNMRNPWLQATSQTKKSFGHFRSQDIVAVGSDFGAGFDLGIIGREFGMVLFDPALRLSWASNWNRKVNVSESCSKREAFFKGETRGGAVHLLVVGRHVGWRASSFSSPGQSFIAVMRLRRSRSSTCWARSTMMGVLRVMVVHSPCQKSRIASPWRPRSLTNEATAHSWNWGNVST